MTRIAPIACALNPENLSERLRWIADLNARALTSSRREGLKLTLEYEPDAVADVRKMVAGEQKCCAFLQFQLSEQANSIRVTVEAPEHAREDADTLFEPFAPRTTLVAAPKTCGCASECGA